MSNFERVGHEQVKFFVGAEVEQTPAYNKKTLFVSGPQSLSDIEKYAEEYRTPHIFLTANRCFDSLSFDGNYHWVGDTPASHWVDQVEHLLNKGYMVTVDYPAHKHAMVLKVFPQYVWSSRNFVPLASVQLPYISTTSQNLTIKIDDVGFGDKGTNPGVWCFNHKELTDNNRFTSWGQYDDDFVITEPDVIQHEPQVTTVVVPEPVVEPVPADTVQPEPEPVHQDVAQSVTEVIAPVADDENVSGKKNKGNKK